MGLLIFSLLIPYNDILAFSWTNSSLKIWSFPHVYFKYFMITGSLNDHYCREDCFVIPKCFIPMEIKTMGFPFSIISVEFFFQSFLCQLKMSFLLFHSDVTGTKCYIPVPAKWAISQWFYLFYFGHRQDCFIIPITYWVFKPSYPIFWKRKKILRYLKSPESELPIGMEWIVAEQSLEKKSDHWK